MGAEPAFVSISGEAPYVMSRVVSTSLCCPTAICSGVNPWCSALASAPCSSRVVTALVIFCCCSCVLRLYCWSSSPSAVSVSYRVALAFAPWFSACFIPALSAEAAAESSAWFASSILLHDTCSKVRRETRMVNFLNTLHMLAESACRSKSPFGIAINLYAVYTGAEI